MQQGSLSTYDAEKNHDKHVERSAVRTTQKSREQVMLG